MGFLQLSNEKLNQISTESGYTILAFDENGVLSSIDDNGVIEHISHIHLNKTILDTITSGGTGKLYLSDDGTYKIVTETDPIWTAEKLGYYTTAQTNTILTGYTQLNVFNSHTANTLNPHNVTTEQISAATLSQFNIYTGITVPSLYSLTSHTHDGRYLAVTGGTIDGNLTIYGKFYVSGTTTYVNTTDMNISDNLITINSGETGSGVTRGYAGIVVDRGDYVDYQFMFQESNQTFRIGESGSIQAVATRQDVGTIVNNGVAYWNGTDYRFDTSTGLIFSANTLTIKGNATGATYSLLINNSSDVNNGYIKNDGSLFFGNSSHQYIQLDTSNGVYMKSNANYLRLLDGYTITNKTISGEGGTGLIFYGDFLSANTSSPVSINAYGKPVNTYIPYSMIYSDNVASGYPNLLLVKDVGNVGVGILTPTAKLHISGDTKINDGDVQIDSNKSYFIGEPNIEGSWKICVTSGNLEFKKYSGGTYVVGQTIIVKVPAATAEKPGYGPPRS